jgi:hypothetical protein
MFKCFNMTFQGKKHIEWNPPNVHLIGLGQPA